MPAFGAPRRLGASPPRHLDIITAMPKLLLSARVLQFCYRLQDPDRSDRRQMPGLVRLYRTREKTRRSGKGVRCIPLEFVDCLLCGNYHPWIRLRQRRLGEASAGETLEQNGGTAGGQEKASAQEIRAQLPRTRPYRLRATSTLALVTDVRRAQPVVFVAGDILTGIARRPGPNLHRQLRRARGGVGAPDGASRYRGAVVGWNRGMGDRWD